MSLKRKAINKRETQWTRDKMYRECSAAPLIWGALQDLAEERGSKVVTPTRELLAAISGVNRFPTISNALTALERGGWIDRVHIPVTVGKVQTATVLRIVLRREHQALRTDKSAVENARRSKGRERQALLDSSLTRREIASSRKKRNRKTEPPSDTPVSRSRGARRETITVPEHKQLVELALTNERRRVKRAQEQAETEELTFRMGFANLDEAFAGGNGRGDGRVVP